MLDPSSQDRHTIVFRVVAVATAIALLALADATAGEDSESDGVDQLEKRGDDAVERHDDADAVTSAGS